MLGLVLPLAIAALAGTAYVVATQPKKGTMTPERQSILDTALSSTAEPDKLRALAKVFRDEGLPLQADLLEKRAALRELPPDVKEGRKAAFRAGMASKNADAIRALANEFEKEGATGAAAALRTQAFNLEHPAATPGAGLGIPQPGDVNAQNAAAQAAAAAIAQQDPALAAAAQVAAASAAAAAAAQQAASFPGAGTVDGHGTGSIDPNSAVAQAAAALAQAQQNLPDPTQSPSAADASAASVAALAQAAEQAKIDAINAAIEAGDHPESSAVAVGLGGLPIFAPTTK